MDAGQFSVRRCPPVPICHGGDPRRSRQVSPGSPPRRWVASLVIAACEFQKLTCVRRVFRGSTPAARRVLSICKDQTAVPQLPAGGYNHSRRRDSDRRTEVCVVSEVNAVYASVPGAALRGGRDSLVDESGDARREYGAVLRGRNSLPGLVRRGAGVWSLH